MNDVFKKRTSTTIPYHVPTTDWDALHKKKNDRQGLRKIGSHARKSTTKDLR